MSSIRTSSRSKSKASRKRAFPRSALRPFLLRGQQLEERMALASTGVIVADYTDDFSNNGVLNSGWKYMWNAPVGWTSSGTSGNLASAPIGDVANYRNLVFVSANQTWTPDGDSNYLNNTPAGALNMYRTSSHPGASGAGSGNIHDRYAIAAYTVDRPGIYAINNSFLTKASTSGDGVEVFVHVNALTAGRAPVLRQVVPAGGTIDFDVALGYLKTGDTIYVGMGADGDTNADHSNWDFSIERQSQEEIVAEYRNDFTANGTPPAGWQYLWNAPSGWGPAAGQTGNMTTNVIGDPSGYRALGDAGTIWTADGNLDWSHIPDAYVQLTSTGGHPGRAAGQSGNGVDRFAIAAYTIPDSGFYGIVDSFILATAAGGDGLEVIVHVNNSLFFGHSLQKTIAADSLNHFNTGLGFLKKNDVVYVAIGANGNDGFDTFQMDFKLARVIPREEPLRALAITQVINLPAPLGGTQDDAPQIRTYIQNAINAAASGTQIVELKFQAGATYRLSSRWNGVDPYAIRVYDAKNVRINGNGAIIRITDPTIGFMLMIAPQDTIVENFPDIDYTTLPFTQGIIDSINGNNIVLKDIPAGFLPPTDALFNNAATRFGWAIDPNVPGRIKDGAAIHNTMTGNATNLGGGKYSIPVNNVTNLAAGDRCVLQATGGSLFTIFAKALSPGVWKYPHQITIQNLTAYASPSLFVASSQGEAINVIQANLRIRSGRWMSGNRDGINILGARVGAWVEDVIIEGQGDDGMNLHANPNNIQSVSADKKTITMIPRATDLPSADDGAAYFRVGDHLTFFNPSTGAILARTRIAAANNYVITVVEPVNGIVTGNALTATKVFNDDSSMGYMIQGTTLRNSRRYGMIVQASNMMIVDSVFEGLSDAAITVHNDADWDQPNEHLGEGLMADNLIIQNNTFNHNGFSWQFKSYYPRSATIQVGLEKVGTTAEVSGQYAFLNLQIIGNTFTEWRKAAVSLRNVRNVTLAGNLFYESIINPGLPGGVTNRALDLGWVDGASLLLNGKKMRTGDTWLTWANMPAAPYEIGTFNL